MITEELSILLNVIIFIGILVIGYAVLVLAGIKVHDFLKGRTVYLIWPAIIILGIIVVYTSVFIGIQTLTGIVIFILGISLVKTNCHCEYCKKYFFWPIKKHWDPGIGKGPGNDANFCPKCNHKVKDIY